ncbi:glycoside hydrolase family 25 protein [Leptospira kmetyi]|uniref:glycoside hydrolase family 25 protein n=1 Tax=Leptospira kmetyi TaxID=408139 RepID=UPI0002883A88|nr:GH25 family lysozyme [Leptospira kmetyi]EQA53169.1 glycoside hydrolase, family 25 [Leptospira kmetyi serovar Malaysia str. Bejo-Iso9]TGL68569.1 lysozyme [Leptospira kmetyi]
MKSKKFFAFLFLLLLFLSGLGLYEALDQGWIWFVSPSRSQYPIRGIDVSNHQGRIDWTNVPKSEVSFVFIKASEGGDFQDKSFTYNWKLAKANGFSVGAYHFFTLCKSGKEQAENFISTVPKEADSLPPVVDLEFVGNCKERPSIENVSQEIRDFLNRVDSYYGKKTILYLTYEFIDRYIGEDFQDHGVWIRDIFKHPNTFSDQRWIFWQYHSRARLPGISGPVDLNVWYGSPEDLNSL